MRKKDLILFGDMFTLLVSSACNTARVSFIMQLGINGYQTACIAIAIASAIASMIVSINLGKRLVSKFKTFMIIEGVMNVTLGLLTLVLNTPMVLVITSVVLAPWSMLQTMVLEVKKGQLFDHENLVKHSMLDKKFTQPVQLAGLGLGLLVNLMPVQVAMMILFFAEALNNVFYMAAVPMKGDDN